LLGFEAFWKLCIVNIIQFLLILELILSYGPEPFHIIIQRGVDFYKLMTTILYFIIYAIVLAKKCLTYRIKYRKIK